MISEHVLDQEGGGDFTKDFTALTEQDYITPFTCPKGQDYDAITTGKNAAKAVVELFPYNFKNATHRTHLTDNGKKMFLNPNTLPPYAPLQIQSIRPSTGSQCSDSQNGQDSPIL
jgi:hypothetical protein